MLFSVEGPGNAARDAHTFASFIRVPDEEDDEDGLLIETTTISWMPTSLNIALLRRPEAGRNLTLEESLRLAQDRNGMISAWGPFEIKKDLYDRGIAQAGRLNRGEIAYKALDTRFRPDMATNCFHAISDIAPGPMLDTGGTWGATVTRMVAGHLAPWFVEPKAGNRWLIHSLGLERYKINYQDDVFAAR